jgi:hypothetical protein
MGSRYLFIALYCWLEKYFSRGDYVKPTVAMDSRSGALEEKGIIISPEP